MGALGRCLFEFQEREGEGKAAASSSPA